MSTVSTIALPTPASTGQGFVAPATGEVLNARVVSQGQDGTARLALGKGQQIEVRLPVQIPPGTAIALKVEAGGTEPRLALMVDTNGQPLAPQAARAAMQGTTPANPGQVAPTPQAPVQPPVLVAGAVLTARVTGSAADGTTRLALSGAELAAKLPTPLPEGMRTVAVKVETGGVAPRLAIVVDEQGRPVSADAVRAQVASTQPGGGQGGAGQMRTGPSFPAQLVTPQPATSASGSQPPSLNVSAGDLVSARVVSQAADGTARLSIGRTQVEVRLPVSLTPGTSIAVKAEAGGTEPRLSALVDPQSKPLAGDVARTVNAARVQPGEPVTIVSGPRALPAAGTVTTARVQQPAGDGTPQLAIGKTVVKVPLATLPEPGATVLVKITGTAERPEISLLANRQGQPLTGDAAKALASARATSPAQATVLHGGPQGTSRTDTSPEILNKAIDEARPSAAARQDSLAPLFANAAAVSGKSGPLPPVLQQVVRDLLGFRVPADGITGEQVRSAAARSGLFSEAGAAQAKGQGAAAQIGAPQALRERQDPPAGARAQTVQAAATSGASDALQALVTANVQGGGQADLKSTLFLLRAVLSGFLGDDADLPQAPRAGTPPPPPRAGAQPQGQPPASARLDESASPQQAARALLSDTEAALSRVRLSQFASHGSGTDAASSVRGAQATHWTFEIPLMVGAGTAMAQFQISRDEQGGGTCDQPEAVGWRLHFALDVPETGPVESLVALGSGGTAVTVWAERPDVAMALRGGADELAGVLELAGIDVASVRIRQGRPKQPAVAFGKLSSGQFLDRRT
ncbi:flagellar hook-length control protein FliK [Breoghania corrubedonensis]|uniref:Flagellar hook-length control protein FliK n=1 Tax=Breoghania corrubedonensis TaxID=665038 RepID=A0A2T5VCF4_9HYPH|nr:flagellar hook-length control protein FliK [Breoghania corrubedonensis]PTW61449.1 flagellar hook-length control protein FliK [Breoghania corrubedonensis]